MSPGPGVCPLAVADLSLSALRISPEHRSGAWFSLAEITDLDMPDGYKRSIARALAVVR